LITDFINSNCDGKKPGVTPASRNRQIFRGPSDP
jgi:hypothetical protein